MGFSLEYGVHISKQNANKIYKLLWTHSFEMVLFLPFFSLFPHSDCIIFLSFADHRQVRLCLFQNGLRHRITLYPPSRKVSFLFCFAFCVYVHVFTRPYTWSQCSWTLGSHLAGWRGLETKRRLFFVNLSSDTPTEKCFGVENVMVRVVGRWCGALIPSYELGCVLGLSYHETQYAIKLKRVILSQFFLMENYLFVAKSAGSYYSWFFRSVVSTTQLFRFRCLNTRNI